MDKVTLENQENFLSDAVAIVEKGRQTAYASVNQAMVTTYWQLGRHIVENEQGGAERAEYGRELIAKLAAELTAKFGKGYTARNLRNFRQFYLIFPQQEIWHTRVPNLTWSHFRHLLRVENDVAREWYLKEAVQEQWSVGQMDMYLQIYDNERKQPDDNPTIGIILCSETDGDVARYSTMAKNDQLYAAKYKLCLPTQEELKREIERQKEIFRLEKGGSGDV